VDRILSLGQNTYCRGLALKIGGLTQTSFEKRGPQGVYQKFSGGEGGISSRKADSCNSNLEEEHIDDYQRDNIASGNIHLAFKAVRFYCYAYTSQSRK